METLPTCLVAKTGALLQRTTVDSVRSFPITTKLAKAIRMSLLNNAVNHDVVLESIKKQLPAWRGSTETPTDARSEVPEGGKEATKLVSDLYFPTHLYESVCKAPSSMKVLDPLTGDVKEVVDLERRHNAEIRTFLWDLLPNFRQEALERPEVAVQAWKMICLNPNADEVAAGLKMFGASVKQHIASTGKGEAATAGASDGASRERAPTEGKHLVRFVNDALNSPNRAQLLEFLFEAPDLVSVLAGATASTVHGGKTPAHIVALVEALIGVVGTGTREGAREKAMLSIIEVLHAWIGGLGNQRLATTPCLRPLIASSANSNLAVATPAPKGKEKAAAKKDKKPPTTTKKKATTTIASAEASGLVVDAASASAFVAEYEARMLFIEECFAKFNKVLAQRPLGMMGFLEPYEVLNAITASITLSASGRCGEEFLRLMQAVFQAGLWNVQRGTMSGSLIQGPLEDSPLLSGANLAFLDDLTLVASTGKATANSKGKTPKPQKARSTPASGEVGSVGSTMRFVEPAAAAKSLGNIFFKDMSTRLAADAEISRNPAAAACFFGSAVTLGHEEGADASYKLLCDLLPTLGSFNNEATANSVLIPILDASSRPLGVAKRYFRARDENAILRIERSRQLAIEAERKRGIKQGEPVGMKLPVVPYPHDVWSHGQGKRTVESLETTFQDNEQLWADRKSALLHNASSYFIEERASAAMYARVAVMPELARDHSCLVQAISMSLPACLHPTSSGFTHGICNRLLLSVGNEDQVAEALNHKGKLPAWLRRQLQHNLLDFAAAHKVLVAEVGTPELAKVFFKVLDTQKKLPTRPSDSPFKF